MKGENNHCKAELFALLVLPLIAIGCARGKDNDGATVIECDIETIPATSADAVRGIEYVVLGSTEEYIPGRIDKAVMDGGSIYVGDYRSQRVFKYSISGELLGVVDKKGRGPGEYLSMRSFTAHGGRIFILDEARDEIMIYSGETLGHIRNVSLDVSPWDFEVLGNGGFILADAPMPDGPRHLDSESFRVFLTDSTGNALIGIVGSGPDSFIGNWDNSMIYDFMIAHGAPRASAEQENDIRNDEPYLVSYKM